MPTHANANCSEELDLESLRATYGVTEVCYRELELMDEMNEDGESSQEIEL